MRRMLTFAVFMLFHMMNSLQFWSVSTTFLPRNDVMVGGVAYSRTNNLIWLIGGLFNQRQLTAFDPNQLNSTSPFQINLTNTLPVDSWYGGQGYTQTRDVLYMINKDGTSLSKFNLTSQEFISNFDNTLIPQSVSYYACMAHIDDHLIITGGGDYVSGALSTVQIYDLKSKSWILPAKNMNLMRWWHACAIQPRNKYLYVIGGITSTNQNDKTDTISKLFVGDIKNIHLYKWIDLNATLRSPNTAAKAVVYSDDIFIIGGFAPLISGHVDRLSLDDTIVEEGSLAREIVDAACIVANETLFVLGGEGWKGKGHPTKSTVFDTIQYTTLHPTAEPTDYPTLFPTEVTNSPSSDPTTNPTEIPTVLPTAHPTINPTFDPTAEPSTNPTFIPTSYSFGIIITVTIEQQLPNSDIVTISVIVPDIISYFIQNQTDIQPNCKSRPYTDGTSINTALSISINVEVVTCNAVTEQILFDSINQNQGTLTWDIMSNLVEKGLLSKGTLVIIDTATISSEFIMTTTNTTDKSKSSSKTSLWIILVVLLIVISLVFVFIFVSYHVKRQRSLSESNFEMAGILRNQDQNNLQNITISDSVVLKKMTIEGM